MYFYLITRKITLFSPRINYPICYFFLSEILSNFYYFASENCAHKYTYINTSIEDSEKKERKKERKTRLHVGMYKDEKKERNDVVTANDLAY
jgi:hypothetical protein